jgi:hypothetical protein
MANYYAIAAVSATLQGLLADARPPEYSTASIDLVQMPDFQKPRQVSEGISIMLYRVAVSAASRSLYSPMTVNGSVRRPPLPVDLYFLMTPWAQSAEVQQRLLGWMMRTMEDTPNLYPAQLNAHSSQGNLFDENETVTLTFDPLSLQDLTNVWDILKPNAQLSVAYVARLLYLDSPIEVDSGSLVQTREFEMARLAR